MSDPKARPTERHPIVTGAVALVGVGLVVGLILGGVAFAGARLAGFGGGGDGAVGSAESSGSGDTLVLPRPQETKGNRDPLVTLAPQPGSGGNDRGGNGGQNEKKNEKKNDKKQDKKGITLSAGQKSVATFDQIDLTGSYPRGDGSVLQVQRFEGGSWAEFNATVAVTDGNFSTYVQSGQTGPNRFRVVDSSNGTKSNEVRVQVG